MRVGTESIANRFFDYYYGLLDTMNNSYSLFMILNLAFVWISQIILIPIVFSVHKTNTKVLALFGYIPILEIKELANRCEKYMETYLEEKQEKRDDLLLRDSESQKEGEPKQANNTYMENFEDGDGEGKTENVKLILTENDNESPVEKADKGNGKETPSNKVTPNPKDKAKEGEVLVKEIVKDAKKGEEKKPGDPAKKEGAKPGAKPGEKKPEDAEKKPEDGNEEDENDRTKKLLNSKDNNRKMIVLQFCLVAFVYCGIFVYSYLREESLLVNVKQAYNNIQLFVWRPSILKYSTVFTYEELATGNRYVYQNLTVRDDYISRVYDNERQIYLAMKDTLPAYFSDFTNVFQDLSYNSICVNTQTL